MLQEDEDPKEYRWESGYEKTWYGSVLFSLRVYYFSLSGVSYDGKYAEIISTRGREIICWNNK